jgi:hypothetical protein
MRNKIPMYAEVQSNIARKIDDVIGFLSPTVRGCIKNTGEMLQ